MYIFYLKVLNRLIRVYFGIRNLINFYDSKGHRKTHFQLKFDIKNED